MLSVGTRVIFTETFRLRPTLNECVIVDLISPCPGGSRRNPAGPRRTARQHEDSGSERQPEASQLCQQPNPQEAEAAGVRSLLRRLFLLYRYRSNINNRTDAVPRLGTHYFII